MLHSLQEALAHSCRVRGLDTHQASGACERNHKGSSPAIEAAGGRGNLEAFRGNSEVEVCGGDCGWGQ